MADTRKPLTERARERWRKLRSHTCSCGSRDCKGYYRTIRELNAHHIRQLPRWTSDKARKMARRMGKEADAARRHARSWLEAAGLVDERGRRTGKGRARPELRGHLTIGHLRAAHRHDRGHDRTQKRAGRRERRAERARAKGRADWGDIHTVAADGIRQRHARTWPERKPAARSTPEPSRPAPALQRTTPSVNGHSNGRANGRTKQPATTGRTRT